MTLILLAMRFGVCFTAENNRILTTTRFSNHRSTGFFCRFFLVCIDAEFDPPKKGVFGMVTKCSGFNPKNQCLSFGRYFLAAAILFLCSNTLRAESFDDYQLAGSFTVPANTHTYDVLSDGRLILLVDDVVWLESAVSTRTFAVHGTLVGADIPSFGAAFIAVSPDGTKIAVGNNGSSTFSDFRVGILDFNTLSGTWYAANHFVAHWLDNTSLMLAASDFSNGSSVTVLDTTSVDANNPDNVTVLQNIGGASGGVAIDAMGRLFTGNGFTNTGPSDSGNVKAFENADWSAALSGGSVPDFEANGTFIIDILGASPLGFDVDGNLFVGGGGSAPDSDSIALVRASAIANVLGGGSSIDTFDAANVRRFDPIPANDFNFYSAEYNSVTGEIYVRDFGDTTIYVYRDLMGVPTVSQWGLVTMSLCMMIIGTLTIQRRRLFLS